MATVNPVVTFLDDNTVQFVYANMLQNDVGAPIGAGHLEYADRNVSVSGTTGAGGAIAVQGSLDGGTVWNTLHDQSDNDLVMSSGNEQILQVTPSLRPSVSGGDGTTSLKAVIVCRRSRPKR